MTHNKYPRTGSLLSLSMIAVCLSVADNAVADMKLDKEGKATLMADVRFRAEADDRSGTGTDTNRERLRLRARIGVGYKANDQWSGKIRLATNSTSLNSPYINLGTGDTSKNGDFGLVQAYITWEPIEPFDLIMGKLPFNFWQQNEQFWDEDINPEGVAAVYQLNKFTINGGYFIVQNNNWDTDVTFGSYQAVYKNKANNLKYTVALGGTTFNNDQNLDASGVGFEGDQNWILGGQIKTGPWLFGLDYLKSNASVEDTGYVAQVRYRITPKWQVRGYWYYVEAFAPPGDGTFSQDNWPNPGSTGVSNFEGPRLQVDYKVMKNTTLDLRYYDASRITDPATLPPTVSDAIMTREEHSRFQLNLTVKL